MEFYKAVRFVGISEGGYDNHKEDSGNYVNGELIGTKFGISANAYYKETGQIPTVEFMKNMSVDLAFDHYKIYYWDKFKIETYSDELRYPIFDMYVNHNPIGVAKILRRATAIHSKGELTLENITNCRIIFYNQIVVNNPKNHVFLKGWIKRTEDVYKNQTGKEYVG